MNFMQTKYLTPMGFTVAVCLFHDQNLFRAATADMTFNDILELPYCSTEEEAQRDLDKLAAKLDLRIEGNQ